MTVVNGFIIVMMILLLVYSFYRLFWKKRTITLITISAQVFAFVLAFRCFIDDIETLMSVELVYVFLGLLLPMTYVMMDYRNMIRRYKKWGMLFQEAGNQKEEIELKDDIHYFNMGMSLYEEGRYVEAVAAYRNALDIYPEKLEVYYYLGSALTEMRNYDDAIEAYKSALEIKPSDSELYYHIAATYALHGRYDIAMENLNRAIELNPELRNEVKTNSAFDAMRDKSEFEKLVS